MNRPTMLLIARLRAASLKKSSARSLATLSPSLAEISVMTGDQRKKWAEAVVVHAPPPFLHAGLSEVEARLRISALFEAAAKLNRWTFLPNHLAMLNVFKRSHK